MSPPQLTRDAPVVDILHPVQVNRAIVRWRNPYEVLLHNFNRAIRERLNLDEPLRREPRLDHRPAPIAFRECQLVIFFANEETLCLEILEHAFASREPIQSRV